MDNRIIIQQCQSGDREAFGSLYRRFSGKMMRIIKHYVPDRQSAEDILHDGFVVILTRIGEVSQPDKLEFWMSTIMKNLCLNYLSQRYVTDILSENADIVEEDPDFEDILGYDEIELLISHLPAGYQSIFRLAVLENKSHKEIGRILGIAPHSSSSQLYRANVLLRRWITENKHKSWAMPLLLLIMGAAWYTAGLYRQDEQMSIAPVHADVDIPAADPEEAITLLVENNAKVFVKPNATQQKAGPVLTPEDIADESVVIDADTTPEVATDTVVRPKLGEWTPNYAQRENQLPRISRRNKNWTLNLSYVPSAHPNLRKHSDDDLYANAPEPWRPEPGIPPQSTYISQEVYNDMPFVVELSLSKRLNECVSISTGLSYTYQHSGIRYTAYRIDVRQDVRTNYIGVPLKLSYDMHSYGRLLIYGVLGAAVDIPVGHSVKTENVSYDKLLDLKLPDLHSRLQLSVMGGIGLQYKLKSGWSLFAEPSVCHYIYNGASMPSYWHEHRNVVSVPVGIKFEW